MNIYISLPITEQDEATQRKKAEKWQKHFEKQGHKVSNPFEIGDRLEAFHRRAKITPPTYDQYMVEDLTELATNDVIFFCDGWHESKGCIIEAETAVQCFNLDILFEKDYDRTRKTIRIASNGN